MNSRVIYGLVGLTIIALIISCAIPACQQAQLQSPSIRAISMEAYDKPVSMSLGQSPYVMAYMPVDEGSPAMYALEVETPQVDPAAGRLVIYNAGIHVVVPRIADAMEHIKQVVVSLGGYMQEMTGQSITLKVPAAQFQRVLAEIDKLGEVTQREIKGNDVTEETQDLQIRLQNAQKMRERLLALLEKAESVEDTLKVEKELGRLTETIEQLKDRIQYLQTNVAFCTVTVYANSPLPQTDVTRQTPFYWVQELTDGMTEPMPPSAHESSSWGDRFELPDGFIKYYDRNNTICAMSANGVMIRQTRYDNYKGGSINFWSALIRRVLVREKVLSVSDERDVTLKSKDAARVIVGTKQIGSEAMGYLAAVAVDKNHVSIYEAWGPQAEFDKNKSKLLNSAKTLKI